MTAGDRLKVEAHTDLFMMGERWCKLERVKRNGALVVIGERSGRRFTLPADGAVLA